jgi:hypothetical protein
METTYNTAIMVEKIKEDLIESRFSLYKEVDAYAPPREIRMRTFAEKAKGYIKLNYPNSDFTEADMDLFVIKIWEKSDIRSIDPWIPMAFCAVESEFTKRAKSIETRWGRARGPFQFIPSTAKSILGAAYTDGCEFNLITSIELWFRFYDILSIVPDQESFENKLAWIAMGYHCGDVTQGRVYDSGVDPQEYLTQISKITSTADKDYIRKIISKYHELSLLNYSRN